MAQGISLLLFILFCLLSCNEENSPNNSPVDIGVKTESEVTGSFIDIRDNKEYKWVKIDTQIWMSENLNFKSQTSTCGRKQKPDCSEYGQYYDFKSLIGADSAAAFEGKKVQGICPNGWHIPDSTEWYALFWQLDKLIGITDGWDDPTMHTAHGLMALDGWEEGLYPPTNLVGFNGLPGSWESSGTISWIGRDGGWWSSTVYTNEYIEEKNKAYATSISINQPFIVFEDRFMTNRYNLRCVKD